MFTPIQEIDGIFFKRDDYFEYAGVKGGKVRTAKLLASKAMKGLVTSGSKQSPQIVIISHIAEKMKLPFFGHTPTGELSPELKKIQKNKFTTIIQHKPGYNSVIIKRGKDFALEKNLTWIPFGMECKEAITETAKQVENIVPYKNIIKRIVVPIGSGMSFLGIKKGLQDFNLDIPLVGVQVGGEYEKRFKKFDTNFFENTFLNKYNIIKSPIPYHTYYKDNIFKGIHLDPIYEAKTIPFLKEKDLLWIVGIRN